MAHHPHLRRAALSLGVAAAAALAAAPVHAAHGTLAREASVGGQVVPMGTFPWAVSLEHTQPGTTGPVKFCGGTLIAPTYVLTAAHCAQEEGIDTAADVRDQRLAVRFGNFDGRPAIAAVRMVTSGSYWVGLWGRRPQHDIALVELASPAPTAPQAMSRAVPAVGQPVTALGYGTTPDSRTMSDDLRQVWTMASAPAACSGPAPAGFQVTVFPKAEICTAPAPPGTTPPLDGATCGGDSGGPLVTEDLSAVVGVVSWGRLNACRTPANQRSSVFAQPGPVAGWLARQTGAGLFGDAPVVVDRAAPHHASLRRGRLVGTGLPVQVSARGTNWRAQVFVQFTRQVESGALLQTVAVPLGPRHPAGTARAPADWGPRPPGLAVLDVAARVWRPDNLNGVTLHAE